MRGLAKLALVEMKLFAREPMGAFFTLMFPLMMLLCFGAAYGNKPSEFWGGYGMVDASVPAYTAIVIAMSGIFLLTIRMAAYREQGILRRFRLTTLRPETVLAAQVFVFFVMTALGMALLVVAGKAIFHLRIPGNLLSISAAFTLSALSFFALGFVIAGLTSTTRTAQSVAMIIFYPMLFLSGATIPREALPATIRHYGQILPLTHVVNLLRGLWIGDSWHSHLTEVAVLGGMLVLGVLISAKTFRWE